MSTLSRIFRAPNWKYALGELALIVSGILIALAANSWYESRQIREQEIRALKQLSQSLNEDHETLLNRADRLVGFATSGKRL
jgi:type II secretory pathway pseudopilin PulG